MRYENYFHGNLAVNITFLTLMMIKMIKMIYFSYNSIYIIIASYLHILENDLFTRSARHIYT